MLHGCAENFRNRKVVLGDRLAGELLDRVVMMGKTTRSS